METSVPRLEVCGNNFWHTAIPSHSHDFIPTPIPGDLNSENSIPIYSRKVISIPAHFHSHLHRSSLTQTEIVFST